MVSHGQNSTSARIENVHGRRRILHFDINRHPPSNRVLQQLREAFAEA
jgi:hypothetical protein